mmetsp:Transcript_58718/g.157303  ORF Transcript_58718/g.157303 Transcript_58718/m.157303 type:complete len:84 (+) Transcript_58718:100-351(+)
MRRSIPLVLLSLLSLLSSAPADLIVTPTPAPPPPDENDATSEDTVPTAGGARHRHHGQRQLNILDTVALTGTAVGAVALARHV